MVPVETPAKAAAPRIGLASALALVAAICLVPGAAQARPGCRVLVYRDGNLSGPSQEYADDQAVLAPDWRNQISSLQVFAGQWTFFKGGHFNGDTIHYGPGTYQTVPLQWNDQINSMQCAAGDAGARPAAASGSDLGYGDDVPPPQWID